MTWTNATGVRTLATAAVFASGVALVAPTCAKEIPDPAGEQVDFKNPKSVLGQVFWAARTGRTESLASLCLPDQGGSASVRRICAVTVESTEWPSFRDNFAKGKLGGEPRIADDSAVLKFHYGPDGASPDTMKLSRVGERWYLESF